MNIRRHIFAVVTAGMLSTGAYAADIKVGVTGSYPALYGWDLSGLELEHDRDINEGIKTTNCIISGCHHRARFIQ